MMKRRTFIKHCLSVLALPCLPQVKAKPKAIEGVKYRKWAKLEAPTMPLVEGIEPMGWKVYMTHRIVNDSYISLLTLTA